MTIEQDILSIPTIEQKIGGQTYKYVRLEEVLATVVAGEHNLKLDLEASMQEACFLNEAIEKAGLKIIDDPKAPIESMPQWLIVDKDYDPTMGEDRSEGLAILRSNAASMRTTSNLLAVYNTGDEYPKTDEVMAEASQMLKQAAGDHERFEFLLKPNVEITTEEDEGDEFYVVYRVNGGRNDKEGKVIGRHVNARVAIDTAILAYKA